jgi:hypothetical protein
MPAYNFMKIWVPKILNGSKAQTIRRRRKYPTKVGDMLQLYTGQRTKQCRLIGKVPCIGIVPIDIYPFAFQILQFYEGLGWSFLTWTACVKLAKKDGFKDAIEFFRFFRRYKEGELRDFEIIKWDAKKLIVPMERPGEK